jgi:hypothetical protein
MRIDIKFVAGPEVGNSSHGIPPPTDARPQPQSRKRLDALKREVQSWPRPRGVHLRTRTSASRESPG